VLARVVRRARLADRAIDETELHVIADRARREIGQRAELVEAEVAGVGGRHGAIFITNAV